MRKMRGMTQIELAKKADISVNSLRRYESGERIPTIKVLREVAEALDVLVDALLVDESSPYKKGDGIQTKFAFDDFLRKLGYVMDFNNKNYFILIKDLRDGNVYEIDNEKYDELLEIENNVVSYTKFQMSEFLNRLCKISNEEQKYQKDKTPPEGE